MRLEAEKQRRIQQLMAASSGASSPLPAAGYGMNMPYGQPPATSAYGQHPTPAYPPSAHTPPASLAGSTSSPAAYGQHLPPPVHGAVPSAYAGSGGSMQQPAHHAQPTSPAPSAAASNAPYEHRGYQQEAYAQGLPPQSSAPPHSQGAPFYTQPGSGGYSAPASESGACKPGCLNVACCL